MVVSIDHSDLDAFEESLIQESADLLWCSAARVSAVQGRVNSLVNETSIVVEISVEGLDRAGDAVQRGVQGVLFCREHVDRDGVVVMGFEELALFALDLELLRLQ
ncbi:MAG: hypothetical protein ACTIAO_11230 [Microbacterium sp.]